MFYAQNLLNQNSNFEMSSREDRSYLSILEGQCKKAMASDPSEINELKMMITQFRVSELHVSTILFFIFKIF